ncbi:MAG: polysaccharide biosynthesis/export family protein [Bacteroidota bacterium]|nr:polysaccharide biosynthesis/export family protein [Bacteroidota bacterium]
MKFKKITIILIGILLITSCVSNKKFVYLQDKGNVKLDSNGVMPVQPYAYKLQKGDILYISLTTDDEKLNKIFVPPVGGQTMIGQGQGVSGSMLYFIGFTIDNQGEFEFPYLGKIKVENKTVEDAKRAIETELKKFFKVFFLQVKVAEFKFSVLGNVNHPGQFFFQQNKVSIIEAISQAGDLQNIANRYELQLYRQNPEGIKLHILDLTDRSLISSPYWFIQPNDILYVVPLKSRAVGDLSSLQSSFGVVAPLLSSLLLVLNTYILVKNLK